MFDNVAMIHEHSKMSGSTRRQDVLGAIEFVGMDVIPLAQVGTLGAASAVWSSSPGRWSESRGWSCSTSPPPGFPTRRPRTWAR